MFAASAPVARVVLTHSTYMHGLVARLARLAAHPDVATVVPGRMATTRSSTERMEIRVTIPVPGGWKVIARQGTTVQEVFVRTRVTREALEALVADAAGGDGVSSAGDRRKDARRFKVV